MSAGVVVQHDAEDRLITRPFVIVTGVALLFFVYVGILVPVLPLFIEGPLGSGEFGIGLTVAVFAIAAIAVRPLVGRIADRYGRRVLMLAGALMAAAGGAAIGYTDEMWQLLGLRAVMGIGEAAVFVGAATLIADLSPRARRAESASYFSVAVFGGLGVGPILGEWMLGDDQFEQAFVCSALFAVAAAVLSMFAPNRVVSPHDDIDDFVAGDDIVAGEPVKRPWIHPVAVMPGLVLACGVAAFATYAAFLPDYSRTVGLSASGGLFAVYAVSSLLVRIFGAKLPERLGPRRAVTIALGNVTIGLLILTFIPSVPSLWIASVFVGLGVAFNYPSLMALTVNRASDRDRAAAVSSFTMFFEVGSAAGGLLIGAFAQLVGKQIGFLGGVASCVIGLWLLRTKLVPAGAPDAGPMSHSHPPEQYTPVAGT